MRTLHFLILLSLFLGVSVLFASPLSDLAASMQPGEWGPLATDNFNNGNVLVTSDNGVLIEYSDEAQWDPVGKKLYIMGTARGACQCYGTNNQKWVVYSESSNSWTVLPRPSFYWGFHGYDHAALDPVRRHYYVRSVGRNEVRRYDLQTGQWSQLPGMPGNMACCSALEYFPEIDRVVYVNTGASNFNLYNPSTNSWSVQSWGISSLGGGIHNISEYDPVNGVLYFTEGQSQPNPERAYRFYKLEPSGTVTQLVRPPIDLGISGNCTNHTVDPVTGKVLLFEYDKKVYEYDPAGNSWKQSGTHPLGMSYGSGMQCVTAKIPEYGVIIAVNYDRSSNSKVYLYKHAEQANTIADAQMGQENDLQIVIHPNPFRTSSRIILPEIAEINIYSITGKLISRFMPETKCPIWNASDMPNGIYILKADMGNKVYSRKLLIQK